MKARFAGSLVALITPFDRKGRVEKKTLEKLVEWHIREGTDGIVCCATTGEGPALSGAEKKQVAEVCIRTAGGRIPIIVGTGLAGTQLTAQLTEKMGNLGADGCLVVTPAYNKPSQRGCILHFQEVAKVGVPIIAYHNPARAVIRLTAETIAAIGQIPGIVALKESSHDLALIRKIRTMTKIPILSGEDDLTLETIREGGVGSCSVTGNVIPRAWKAMVQQALQGKWDEAERAAKRFMPFCETLFLETNPQCVKFVLGWMGRASGHLRLPLVSVEGEVGEKIRSTFVSLYFPFLKKKILSFS